MNLWSEERCKGPRGWGDLIQPATQTCAGYDNGYITTCFVGPISYFFVLNLSLLFFDRVTVEVVSFAGTSATDGSSMVSPVWVQPDATRRPTREVS